MAVAITRRDLSVGDLRREAAGTRDAKASRRMLAIAFVLERKSREDAAENCGVEPRGSSDMDRQTLRDWVHHYNKDGLAGLANRPRRNGPSPRLSPGQEAVVAEWVEQGPDLARDGVVRWRCADLQGRIEREWGISLHERTVGKALDVQALQWQLPPMAHTAGPNATAMCGEGPPRLPPMSRSGPC